MKDRFAEIAQTRIAFKKEYMQPVQAFDFPVENVLSNSLQEDYTIQLLDEESIYKNDLQLFNAQLDKLKAEHASFLKRRNKCINQRKRVYFKDFDFRFETKEDIQDFSQVLNNKGTWEAITLPHYHGPTGKWSSYYRKVFDFSTSQVIEDSFIKGDFSQKEDYLNNKNYERQYLVFKGSDYITKVYLNGRMVLQHEGFFAAFEEDITDYLKEKDNLIIIQVDNDYVTTGEDGIYGPKIYAATGIGWDNPQDGWHHCPPGGGIFDKVYIESRAYEHVSDAYVLPDIDRQCAFANVVINGTRYEDKTLDIELLVEPFNFDSDFHYSYTKSISVRNGKNYYSFEIPMQNMHLWDTKTPNLYTLKIFLRDNKKADDSDLYDTKDSYDTYEVNFGMRKFHMDTKNKDYGTLYLNNKEVILRGANEMGHLQLCVMNEDYDQLIEDILIAKYCNMNYYRITQRPVQSEIYEYCDMLGIMVQADFPLFGQLLRSQFYEASRQVGEMERHIRRHPSVIMLSYINETTDQNKSNMQHINLVRSELESWFDICDKIVMHENPDRVIKRIEGDYDPPTFEGLSDFHCYNMWYTNHAISIGDLYKGMLPPIRKDWKASCGEYGVEGLDNLKLMLKFYPKQWLPENLEDFWLPDKIVKAQTNSMHGDWYFEQEDIKSWIKFSQAHQAMSVHLMTMAFRRRSSHIVQTALHLLIDAYPAGWMKTVVGVDRVPKTAYFSFKRALNPIKASIRCDRWSCYHGETVELECWIYNDTSKLENNLDFEAIVCDSSGSVYKKYKEKVDISACNSDVFAHILLDTSGLPKREREKYYIKTYLYDHGILLDEETFTLEIHKRKEFENIKVHSIGKAAKAASNSCPYLEETDISKAQFLIISDSSKAREVSLNLPSLYMLSKQEQQVEVKGSNYSVSDKRMWNAVYTPIDTKLFNEIGWEDVQWNDISFLYDEIEDKINFTADYFVETEQLDELYAWAYKKPYFTERSDGKKEKLPVLFSSNKDLFTTLNLQGRLGLNPTLDLLLYYVMKRMI